MRSKHKNEAALSTVDFVRGKSEINGASANGLQLKITRAPGARGLTHGGRTAALCAMMLKPSRMRGCRLGGLRCNRRITAAPRLYARGFSFGASPCTGSNAPARGIRYPGRIASTDFTMSAPGGEPSGSPFPKLRSANLPGVALLLAEECGKDNSNLGNPAMNLHVTEGAPARALNLGVCKLLNLINRLTGRAGGVRPRGSYPGVDLGMHIPSIFELNPELLELAHAEALKHSQEVRHE